MISPARSRIVTASARESRISARAALPGPRRETSRPSDSSPAPSPLPLFTARAYSPAEAVAGIRRAGAGGGRGSGRPGGWATGGAGGGGGGGGRGGSVRVGVGGRGGERPGEHRVEHLAGEPAGECVLLAGVVAADQDVAADLKLGAVGEAGPGAGDRRPPGGQRPQRRVPGEAAQAEDHPHLLEQLELAHQVGQAVVPLGGRRAVGGRGAADGRGDVAAVQTQAVITPHRLGLVGQAGPVQRAEQPVARTVAGEDPPSPIAAVGGGSQPEDEDARPWIPEAGQRTAPVLLPRERGPLALRHLLTPGDQTRAATTGDHLSLQRRQRHGGGGRVAQRRSARPYWRS